MKATEIPAQPVVIIGAGRSGTNMLRDVLTSLKGVKTWPCDEINYIWRQGNRDFPTDELTEKHATEEVSKNIRVQFSKIVGELNLQKIDIDQRYIVEKTCANSLRVDFVDIVLPEAKYIFLVRDGRDVIASARKRWRAPLDIPYLLAKAKYVPKSDLLYYASRYLLNRVAKNGNREKALSVWGPKFDGMSTLSEHQGLDYLCAEQWVRCVASSQAVFDTMPADKYYFLRYEDFVSQPLQALTSIAEFMEMDHDIAELKEACSSVRTESVGKGHKVAFDETVLELMTHTLKKYGYN